MTDDEILLAIDWPGPWWAVFTLPDRIIIQDLKVHRAPAWSAVAMFELEDHQPLAARGERGSPCRGCKACGFWVAQATPGCR